ncbi:hypothetical protein [Roseomonas indoligenes]|uniref:Uncharacterized protein n=1 Tax=Roseomonas indoligenes TaxID=2820811 RepID=A0A940N0V9_9PROT|nr:hypothetical protein [Pararoseomonas indoligenes]MBP0492247.1 hypothetical protein [Pararoseomonas indoligenes]
MRLLPAVLALLLAPLPALAADCLGLGAAGTPAELRMVRDGPPHPLYRGAADASCPAETAACRSSATLGPRFRVVAGEANGAFTCVVRADAKGRMTAGWLPTSALALPPEVPPLRAADWIGRWHSGTDRYLIVTATLDGALVLRGEAREGARAARRGPRPAVHHGVLDARIQTDGDDAALVIGEDGAARPDAPEEAELCRVALRRRGPYLIVQDNGRCGEAGVGFTGAYRRTG